MDLPNQVVGYKHVFRTILFLFPCFLFLKCFLLKVILDSVVTASRDVQRECQLVAVSKTKPSAMIQACYEAGQRHFGENYVQVGLLFLMFTASHPILMGQLNCQIVYNSRFW